MKTKLISLTKNNHLGVNKYCVWVAGGKINKIQWNQSIIILREIGKCCIHKRTGCHKKIKKTENR